MSKIIHDTFEVDVLSVFPVAIEYDDYTGLTGDEVTSLKAWLEGAPDSAVFEYGDETHYGECEITGWMGDVITLTVNYNFHEKETGEQHV